MEPNLQPPKSRDQLEDIESTDEQEQATSGPYFNEEKFERPEQQVIESSEIAEPANSVSPLTNDTSLVNKSTTPLSPENAVVTPTTPVDTVPTQTVVQAPKKKNQLWLWVTLGAIFLIVVGLLVSFFLAKNAADTAAQMYTSSVKSYLDDVYDAATSAAMNPSEVQKTIESIKAPILASTLLGGASSDYSAADKLKTEVTSKVDKLTTEIKGYAQVYKFYSDYLGLYSDLRVLDTTGSAAIKTSSRALISTYLSSFRDKLGEVKNLSTNPDLPSELSASAADIGKVFSGMYTNWSTMVSAFDSGNSGAYDVAFANYEKSNNGLDNAIRPITEYYNSLSSKTRDSAKKLQAFRNTIK